MTTTAARLAWWWRRQRAASRAHWATLDYRRWPSATNAQRWETRVRELHRIEAGRP